MTTNELPLGEGAFLRSPEIFRPRHLHNDTEWPLERTLLPPMHQSANRTTTTIAQDIEDLLQFLDDFAFPDSPEVKLHSSSQSVRTEIEIVTFDPPDSLSVHVSPEAATLYAKMAAPETEVNLGETVFPPNRTPDQRCLGDDDSLHNVLPAAPVQFEEEEERRVKLAQWVRQIRAAVQETVQHYRHYIHLLQQQKSSPGADTSEPQQILLSYESELHALHCQLQQLQYEYQQTVESLQAVIEQQSQTIRDLQQQRAIVGRAASPLVESTSLETAAANTATPVLRRISPPPNNGTQRVGSTPMISPHSSSSSSKKENRSARRSANDVHCRHRSHTAAARIVPSEQKNCKTIQFHNGTIQEIYYAPPSSSSNASSQRHRRILYDIIRFANGDIKMTTTTCAKGEPEIYYYYAASSIIQLTHSSSSSSKTAQRITEYHYPNGQVEYHHSEDGLVVVKCPNGRVLHQRGGLKQLPMRRRNDQPRGKVSGHRSSTQLHG
jgi:hypothetical protein